MLGIRITHRWSARLPAIAVELLLGIAGLALITSICFWIDAGIERASFAYIILIVLVSLLGSFVGSVVLSIIAAVGLDYFFTLPLFNVRPFENFDDTLRIAAFLTTSLVVTALVSKANRTREALAESTAKLEEAQRIAHVGWWERRLQTNSVALSAEACRIFGVQPTRFGRWHERWQQLIHPGDRQRVIEASAAAVLPGGPRYDIEYRVVRADGAERIVHSRGDVVRDDSGRPVSQFGVIQDITELRKTEQELRASEVRFRTFVDHATDAFFVLDDQLIVLDVNIQACVGLKYSREELIGAHPRDFDFDLNEASIQQLRQRITAGETVTFETRHRRKDGTTFPVEIRAGQFEQGGRRVLCLARDVTERKRAEERAQEQSERLRQLEADLAHMHRLGIMGELAASLAHEVLHPIAAARNNARAGMRFLEKSPPNLAEVMDALACVVRDADRAKDIVARIRDHIRKAPPQMELIDLNEAINEVIVMVRNAVDRNRVSLRTHLIKGMISVRGDRVQLQQVILNLILNAVEAMSLLEEGTRELSITTSQDRTGDILVAVQDSGPGIDSEHLDRVFEPFYTTKTSGIGMGLSICRSIIAAHGGRLWAEANRPRGAIFQFTLPTDLQES